MYEEYPNQPNNWLITLFSRFLAILLTQQISTRKLIIKLLNPLGEEYAIVTVRLSVNINDPRYVDMVGFDTINLFALSTFVKGIDALYTGQRCLGAMGFSSKSQCRLIFSVRLSGCVITRKSG